MKPSNQFNIAIKCRLDAEAKRDDSFAKMYSKTNKSLSECCDYILLQVKKKGVSVMTDAEVYGMAIHYYTEDDIKVDGSINAKVVHAPEESNTPVVEHPSTTKKVAKVKKLKKTTGAKPIADVDKEQMSIFDFL